MSRLLQLFVLLSGCSAQSAPDVPEIEPPAIEVPAPPPPIEVEKFCTIVPNDVNRMCWHSLGGRFSHGACVDDGQCCEGAFQARESCGICSGIEPNPGRGYVHPEAGTERCFQPFEGSTSALPDEKLSAMRGSTWKDGCPVPLEELALLSLSHWDFEGRRVTGELVVRRELAPVFIDVFRHAYQMQFPIERMELASVYGGDDKASMAVNNTSAFNCRPVTGGTRYSEHSFGHALDLNPRQNPYVSASGKTVLPREGRAFLDRDSSVPGLISDPGPVVGAFRRHGWGWGGSWTRLKDYQHFSENNR